MVVNLSMLDVNLCYNINACTNKNVTFWCLNWCLDLMPWFYVDFRDFYKCLSWCLPFCGRPLSVAWAKSMLCFANFILFIFYGRLMLRPRLTEVRETFTRGGPWVSIEKLLLGFFLVLLKLHGGPKKWRNLAYFQRPSANFLLSRPNAAEYCNSEEKKLLSTDGCSTRAPGLVNFGLQTPEIHASFYFFRNLAWPHTLKFLKTNNIGE